VVASVCVAFVDVSLGDERTFQRDLSAQFDTKDVGDLGSSALLFLEARWSQRLLFAVLFSVGDVEVRSETLRIQLINDSLRKRNSFE